MKTRLIILGLSGVVLLAAISTVIAYYRGYRHGGEAERACWKLDGASIQTWFHGEVTARRDTTKHPLIKPPRIEIHHEQSVNSISRDLIFEL